MGIHELRICNEDKMMGSSLGRPVFPFAPVASGDVVGKGGAFTPIQRVDPYQRDERSGGSDAAEEGVAASEPGQLL